jgi:hypothetical protein
LRSINEKCLNRLIPHVQEFITLYHRERNHQGLENDLIEGAPTASSGWVHRRQRLGGLLNYFWRAA